MKPDGDALDSDQNNPKTTGRGNKSIRKEKVYIPPRVLKSNRTQLEQRNSPSELKLQGKNGLKSEKQRYCKS